MSHTVNVGPFQLHKPIDKGAMGEVWEGVHLDQQVPVAVKVLSSDAARDEECLANFRNEMRHVAGLDHPGIITVFDHGVIDHSAALASEGALPQGSPYLVMELARNGSLARVKRPYQWGELRGILVALLDALAHAHARGVIHRDLKPQNVLVISRSSLKLSDFGIAHALDVHTRSGTLHSVSGTVHYMAPEQILGHWRDYGPWTDLYGLGCLAYKLATGRAPFHDFKGKAVLRAHFKETPPVLKARAFVPEGFAEWVSRLMEKDRRNRFPRAADAAWALVRLGEMGVDDPTEEGAIPLLSEAGSSTTSLVFRRDEEDSEDALHVFTGALAPESPPLPMSWRRTVAPRPTPQLMGTGLGLYGVRSIPLVDREVERDTIWRIFRRVVGDRTARCVFIQGAAGTGKSRLMGWVCERAHELGAATILRASNGPQEPDAGGISHMLATYLRCHRLPRVDVRERVEDFLASRGVRDAAEAEALTEMICPSDDDGKVLQNPQKRHHVARRFFELLARERPVIVALDDIHWGHDALGLVIAVMSAQSFASIPILFLLSARNEALAVQSVEVARLQQVMAFPESTSLELGPLGVADSYSLVQELLGLEEALAARVVERTLGSPQFAVELVGDWVERGVLEMGPDGFRLVATDSAPLPDDVHQVWRSRLKRALRGLPKEATVCLELAACLGHDVDEQEWQEVCDFPQEVGELDLVGSSGQVMFSPRKAKIRAHLVDRLLDQRLAQETELGWAFAHAMVRESLARSAREHGNWDNFQLACAKMLERRSRRGLRGAAERIGLHLVDASRWDDAIGHLMKGVRDRQTTRGYRPALALLATCESTMDEARLNADDPRWGDLWNTRSSLCFHHGDLGDAEFWAERAANAASQHGWHSVYRQGLFLMAQVSLRRSDLSRAEARLMELKAVATQGTEDPLMLGKALFGLAAVARNRQQFDRAYQAYGEARGNFVQCGELMLAAACWRDMAAVELKCGDVEPARELYEKALGLFEASGNMHDVAYCVNGLGEVARATGALDDAENYYNRSLSLFDAVGATQINVPRLNLALVLVERSRYADARALASVAVVELERQGRRRLLGAAYMVMVPCDAGLRDWDGWDAHFEAASQLLRETGFAEPDCAACALRAGNIARRASQRTRAKRAYQFALYQYLALGDEAKAEEVQLIVHRYG